MSHYKQLYTFWEILKKTGIHGYDPIPIIIKAQQNYAVAYYLYHFPLMRLYAILKYITA